MSPDEGSVDVGVRWGGVCDVTRHRRSQVVRSSAQAGFLVSFCVCEDEAS